MTRRTRPILIALLLVCAAAMTGCIKLRQVVTLMPDGSGKIQLRYALSEQMMNLAQDNGDDPFAEVRPDALSENTQGVVAFSEPTVEEIDDYTYLTYNVYFRDINMVSINGLGEGAPARYHYVVNGDSATLTLTDGVILSMVADYEPTDDANADDVRRAMAGMLIQEHFVLPGDVTSVPGVTTQGNTAQINLSIDNFVDGDGPIESLRGQNAVRFEIADIAVSDDQVQAFNAELEAAIQAWNQ